VSDGLYGLAGNDRLDGGDGRDGLHGGEGDDRLLGRAGNDLLYAGPGADRVVGGSGNDWADSSLGDDVLYGGPGSDHVVGGSDADGVYGDDGEDLLDARDPPVRSLADCTRQCWRPVVPRGADVVDGGDGNDRILAVDGRPDVIRCREGRDQVTADQGDAVSPFGDCELVERR
jgi:Ca2+-binding RTX toxin-like protein